MSLRIRRGTEAQRTGVVFDSGELVVTTDEFRLFVGDGITQGGRNIALNLAGSGLVFNPTTGKLDVSGLSITTDDVPEGDLNKYFSNELAQDAVAAALTAGTHQGITFIYNNPQDTGNRIDATVSLSLNDLADVVIGTPPTNGQVLKYNSVAQVWEPGTGGDGGSGILSVVEDTTPQLGGDLDLNTNNITGVGNIDVIGTFSASSGLSANLNLNTNSIIGTGSVNIAGDITSTSLKTNKLTISKNAITSDGVDTIDLVTPSSQGVSVRSITAGQFSPNISSLFIRSSRGTIDIPTSTIAGDVLGQFNVEGFYNTDFKTASVFGARWADTATLADASPSSDAYIVTNGGGAVKNYFTFDHRGVFNAPIIEASGYATGSLPSSPDEGWIVFDNQTKQFKGWNGTSWVVLG